MKALLLLLPLLFLVGCVPPQENAGQEWFQGAFQRQASAKDVCSMMSDDYIVEQWQRDALGNSSDRQKSCQLLVRSIQEVSQQSLLGAVWMAYKQDESLGLACFREEASGKTALLPVVFSGLSRVEKVEIAPHVRARPGKSSWQSFPEINRAGDILRRQLPDDCQRLAVWG